MGLKNEIAKNNIIFTSGNMAVAVLSFLFNITAAWILPAEQFGLFSFALVSMGLFTVFADLGVSSTIVKFMSSSLENGEMGKVHYLMNALFKMRLLLAGCVGLLLVVLSPQIAAVIFNKPGNSIFIAMAGGLIFANSIIESIINALIALKNFTMLTCLKMLERIFRIVFVVFIVLAGFKAVGAVAGVMLGFFAVGLLGFLLIRRRYRDIFSAKPEAADRKLLMKFGFWVLFGSVVTNIYLATDSTMISALRSVQEVGFYSIAISWMTLITYMVPMSSYVMYPYFSRFDVKKNVKALQKSIRYTLSISLPLGFLMSAFSASIIAVFYRQVYAPAAGALALLSFLATLIMVSQILGAYFYGTGKPKIHTAVITASFAINIIANYLMITSYGFVGAATGTIIARLLEISALITIVWVMDKAGFPWQGVVKPLAASVAIYIIALLLPVSGLLNIIIMGVALLVVYAAILFAIGGIERDELNTTMGWFRSRFARR